MAKPRPRCAPVTSATLPLEIERMRWPRDPPCSYMSACRSPSTGSACPEMLLPRGRGEKHDRVGDVLGGHEPAQRRPREAFGTHDVRRHAARRRLVREHAFDARACDEPRADRIDANAERTELARQRFGEADDAPLRRRVRRAHRIAEAAGRRRKIRDARVAARLEQRDRALRAEELPGQVDGDRALPIGERDVLARRRWARRCRHC